MSKNSGKQTKVMRFAPLGLAISLAAGVGSTAQAGYLTDSQGMGVLTGYGECWETTGGVPSVPNIDNCGGKAPKKVMPKKKVVPPPAPQPPSDSDGDGVYDDRDECPDTPRGVKVNSFGCPLDSDGDGVPDYKDECPNTRAGAVVNDKGCEIIRDVTINLVADEFDFDSAKLKPAMITALDGVAESLNASPGVEQMSIVGHTDSTGPDAYNQGLSERRAQSVADYLASKGIPRDSMTISGRGEAEPIADNGSRAGRSKNRRVEIRSK